MMTIMSKSQGNVLGVRATGRVTQNDYEGVLIPQLETLIRNHGQARFLCYMDEAFRGLQAKAMWDDAVFGLRHRNDFTKVAVVGRKRWIQWAVRLSRLFMPGDMRTFPASRIEDAWRWVAS